MAEPDALDTELSIDFTTAVAYTLGPTMRRLLALSLVGGVVFAAGVVRFFDATFLGPQAAWLVVAVAGAGMLFAGLAGALFKLVLDANLMADAAESTTNHVR